MRNHAATRRFGASTLALVCILAGTLAVPTMLSAQGTCAALCEQVRDFTATITDVRTSNAGRNKLLTVLMRLQNRTTHPIILGYVNRSGTATDDQGNVFVMQQGGTSGIGVISSRVDPKFVLQPGEASDARFNLVWEIDPRRVYGTSYTLDLTIREIEPVGASQLRLGSEFALRFAGLANGVSASRLAASPPAPSQQSPGTQVVTEIAAATSTAGAESSARGDDCAGAQHCYDAGPFTATVTSVTGSRAGNRGNHLLDIRLRVHNVSAQPLSLAYTSTSSGAVDNLGNRYYWGHAGSHDVSVQGMGLVTSGSADPQFTLQPGESREATFRVTRYNVGQAPLGTVFTYDLSLEQLRVLPTQQVQMVRQYTLHFDGLGTGTFGQPGIKGVTDALGRLQGLFGKKKTP